MKKRLATLGLSTLLLLAFDLEAAELPSETGQSTFAAIAEIAGVLEADEATDWNRVSLLALREHLVDMNEVLTRAAVEERAIDGGVGIRVTGEGRTLAALQRMIPMHSHMVQDQDGWQVGVKHLPDGFEIELTTADPGGVARLRGLGFFGFLAAGDHHRRHHLAIATGAMMH